MAVGDPVHLVLLTGPGPMVCCAQAQRLESATAESACATRTLMGYVGLRVLFASQCMMFIVCFVLVIYSPWLP